MGWDPITNFGPDANYPGLGRVHENFAVIKEEHIRYGKTARDNLARVGVKILQLRSRAMYTWLLNSMDNNL